MSAIEAALIAVRWSQYLGAAVLFGLPVFVLRVIGTSSSALFDIRARAVLAGAAALLALASLLSIGVQASLFAGSFREGFTAEGLGAVVTYMSLGKAALARAAVAAAVFVLAVRPGGAVWRAALVPGAIAAATLGWMGHAAAAEGPLGIVRLAADILHAMAACLWIGSLVGFALALSNPTAGLHRALARFSAIGTWLVATLAITGLANLWFVAGLSNLPSLITAPYGQLMIAKLVAFAAMLALAAANRWVFTPRLAGAAELRAVRRSIALEATLGFGVLALVAWLGTLAPPGV